MAGNNACHCSLLWCLFGWRAGSIGELSRVNGQADVDGTPNVSRVERQDERNDCLSSFFWHYK